MTANLADLVSRLERDPSRASVMATLETLAATYTGRTRKLVLALQHAIDCATAAAPAAAKPRKASRSSAPHSLEGVTFLFPHLEPLWQRAGVTEGEWGDFARVLPISFDGSRPLRWTPAQCRDFVRRAKAKARASGHVAVSEHAREGRAHRARLDAAISAMLERDPAPGEAFEAAALEVAAQFNVSARCSLIPGLELERERVAAREAAAARVTELAAPELDAEADFLARLEAIEAAAPDFALEREAA